MRLSHFTVLAGATFAFPDAQQDTTTSEKRREGSGEMVMGWFPIYDNAPTLLSDSFIIVLPIHMGFSYAFISISLVLTCGSNNHVLQTSTRK